MIEATLQHLLDCVALVYDNLLKRPDFVLEVMRANDLVDLIRRIRKKKIRRKVLCTEKPENCQWFKNRTEFCDIYPKYCRKGESAAEMVLGIPLLRTIQRGNRTREYAQKLGESFKDFMGECKVKTNVESLCKLDVIQFIYERRRNSAYSPFNINFSINDVIADVFQGNILQKSGECFVGGQGPSEQLLYCGIALGIARRRGAKNAA
ncbi:hypothetical protein AVEN_54065-1 [Araneus ventricosus]|uniref:Uncharacterized protein n=1 Tax=Araneus ventricosus TaxID=182803 RepID=A0A4Y2VFE0_ARAVE|nr:hypothetical protein AVEN_54065-1 [Araneus ventricosus]